MAGTVAGEPDAGEDELSLAGATAHARDEQPWPPPRRAWTAVSIIAFSLVFLQIDKGVVGFLIEPMKQDFQASDAEMSLLLGVAPVVFYALVGLPMARLVDRYPRNIVLSIGIFFLGFFTMLCGVAQGFRQLFFCRMFTGTAETVHGPGSYSMVADYFPPEKLPRAIGVIQLGFTIGQAGAQIIGGALVSLALTWPAMAIPLLGGTIRPWQYVFIIAGIPGLVIALLVWAIPEPQRRGLVTKGDKALPFSQMLAEIRRRKGIYLPMFIALALTSLETYGILPWRAAFLQRAYGWDPARIGAWSGVTTLICSGFGILYGTWLTERLYKKYDDAPLRALLINYVSGFAFVVGAPLMPTAELSIISAGIGTMFGIAGAIPQNAALQTITPNPMRGQVTAIFLFMFTVIGGLGASVLTAISGAMGGERHLGGAMSLMAGVMIPIAFVILSLALRPYREEIRARKAAGVF
jgi:MFS family permease